VKGDQRESDKSRECDKVASKMREGAHKTVVPRDFQDRFDFEDLS